MIMSYGLTAWAPFYAVTKYHLPLARVGLEMGFIAAAAGLIGTYLGGALADYARRFTPRGALLVSFFGQMAPVPLVPIMLMAPTLETMLAWWMAVGTLMTMWFAGTASATQDLVLPRMRGTSAATHTLCMTMIGLGFGPYMAGLISDVTGSLFTGIVSVYAVAPLIAICMITAIVTLPKTEAHLYERAGQAGER
jgi:fucose permease